MLGHISLKLSSKNLQFIYVILRVHITRRTSAQLKTTLGPAVANKFRGIKVPKLKPCFINKETNPDTTKNKAEYTKGAQQIQNAPPQVCKGNCKRKLQPPQMQV